MWQDATIHFRRAVRSLEGSAFFTCYPLKWNEKTGRAEVCLRKSWRFRNFQLYTAIMTMIALPVLLAKTFQLVTSNQVGATQDLKVFLGTFVMTDFLCICIPYVWCFSMPSVLQMFVASYEATIRGDKQIEGGITIKCVM